jgi:phospholipase/carboxylesterase
MSEQALGFVHRYVEGSSSTTLLLLHGTGGDENDLLPLGRALAPEANLLSPRGKVLEAGMPRFFRRLAMGVFDVEDLKRRTHELGDFIEEASTAYGLDQERIVALGYSNGANIAASLLLLRPGLLRAAALLHAMVPFQPDDLPDLSGTSALVTAGRNDTMIPPDHPEMLARMLEQTGADVVLDWHPGGHQLGPAELAAVKTWLDQLHHSRTGG